MAKVVTAKNLRDIRYWLNKAGMVCHVKKDCHVEVVCARDMKWGNARGVLEAACFVIREVCEGIVIELVHWEDVGNDLHIELGLSY